MLILDDASIHHSARVKQLCSDAGVILIYLPPYLSDFNPIEEFFAELKRFIEQNWELYEQHPNEGFATFLRGCAEVVGSRWHSAKGHFIKAGLTVEQVSNRP